MYSYLIFLTYLNPVVVGAAVKFKPVAAVVVVAAEPKLKFNIGCTVPTGVAPNAGGAAVVVVAIAPKLIGCTVVVSLPSVGNDVPRALVAATGCCAPNDMPVLVAGATVPKPLCVVPNAGGACDVVPPNDGTD